MRPQKLPGTKIGGVGGRPGKIGQTSKIKPTKIGQKRYHTNTTSDETKYPKDPKRPPRHPPHWPKYPPVITTLPVPPYVPETVTTLPPNTPPPGVISLPPNQPPPPPPGGQGQGPVAQAPNNFLPPPPGETRFVPDEVLLSVPANVSVPALDAIAQRNQLTRLDVRDFTMTGRRLALMRINDGRPVAIVIAALQGEAGLGGAQPNFLYSLEQGGGGAVGLDQYAYAKMKLPQAHALVKGNSIRVAVVDTPVDAKHPDLVGAVAASYDATGAGDKPHSHGTAIAGIIAAHGRLTGAAPSVQILAVSSFSAQASTATSMNILKGLDWAGASSADVVNMSFSGAADAEIRRMLGALKRKGIVLIAAAGNKGPNSPPLYPAAEPDVIAVTATDADDKLFNQANRGKHIAVAAPGVAILVAAPNESYNIESGTSMASAQVSGIAALLLEHNRNLDPAAIREILVSTAQDLGPAGHDDQFGAGLVDAFAALASGGARASEVSAAARARN
jgi:subtilisin family serine protease